MGTEEMVLVVLAAAVKKEIGELQGYKQLGRPKVDTGGRPRPGVFGLLSDGSLSFRPRAAAEADEALKQVVTYTVFEGAEGVFCYRRNGESGEARLRGMMSLGVGGHVDLADCGPVGTPGEVNWPAPNCGVTAFANAYAREIAEEVAFPPFAAFEVLEAGLVNDDSTPVGRVHLGFVHRLRLNKGIVPRAETKLDAGFVPVAELVARREEFENWSRMIIDAVYAPRAATVTVGGLDGAGGL